METDLERAERRFAALSQELARSLEQALPGWVVAAVRQVLIASTGRAEPAVMDAARVAGQDAAREIGAELRSLLGADIDHQRTTPLAVVRGAVRYPTEVLRAAGVPPTRRDEVAERQFPGDDYDLTPARFADLASGEPGTPDAGRLAELGIEWGAAKAYLHRSRHRRPLA